MKLRAPLVALALLLFVPAAQAAHFRDRIAGKTLRVWGFKAGADCHALPVGTFSWRIQVGKSVRRVSYPSACTARGTTVRLLHFKVLVGRRAEAGATVSQLTLLRGKHAQSGTRIKITASVSGYAVFDRPYTASGGSLRRGWPQPPAQGSGSGGPVNLGGSSGDGSGSQAGGTCSGC
jgi:hypothetical protein